MKEGWSHIVRLDLPSYLKVAPDRGSLLAVAVVIIRYICQSEYIKGS